MSATDHTASQSFVAELFERAPKRQVVAALAWALAVGGHAMAATLAAGERSPGASAGNAVEVEFLEPEPAPPPEPPPPVPEEPEPEPAQREAPRAMPDAPVTPPPSAPAAAGALLTAKDDAVEPEQKADLIDFASDPTSKVYGGGVVAVGGVGTFGQRGARLGGKGKASSNPHATSAPRGPSRLPVGASDLSRRPRLGEADPCRGFFPSAALDDSAVAAVMVVVGATGRVDKATVLSESPGGQGFGHAARACMLSKRFVPALDRNGTASGAAIRVNVRFRR